MAMTMAIFLCGRCFVGIVLGVLFENSGMVQISRSDERMRCLSKTVKTVNQMDEAETHYPRLRLHSVHNP